MIISTYDEARQAVAMGMAPAIAARALVSTLTPEERLWCLDGDGPALAGLSFMGGEDGYYKAPVLAAQIDRIGLPGIAFADGPRGSVIGNGTCFPVSMARGATWDPALEERVGDAIGQELRAAGATFTGAVCVNLLRHPGWGRAQETYGEDPFHVGEMGAAFTRGLQRHVLACVKHLACNSMENARFSVDIEIDEVALHEVYLPHFRRIVDEGVASVMSAYNSVNGAWCGQNRTLLTEVLRDEWGFAGFVISDFVFGLRDAASSLTAGLDIEMPYRMTRAQHLGAALGRGDATWDDVDAAAERVVSTLLRFDDVLSAAAPPRSVLGSPEHRDLAREVAARSVVLLRNEPVHGAPVLPLRPDTRVAVVGRFADTVNLGDGGSSDVWDLDCHTVADGLRATLSDVVHDDGSDPERAAAIAGQADVAIVVIGYSYLDEGEYLDDPGPWAREILPLSDEPEVVERFRASLSKVPPTTKPERLLSRARGMVSGGDRSSLHLPATEVELIRAVSAANPFTVVAMQAGSAIVVTEWVGEVPAVVQSWYGGCRAGPGLVDVLLGRVNPTGRLPFSVPVDDGDLPPFDRNATSFRYDRWHGWRYLARARKAPAYPFGFGLSYTTFALADVEISREASAIVARGTVHNTGAVAGSDVVQVYAELPDPEAPPRLVGFARVDVPADDQTAFEIPVPVDRLETRDDMAHAWVPARGWHRILVARHAGDPAAYLTDIDL
jgi:beta-glucosidase